ncbi:MAG: acyl-CoA thioesterase [Sulfobacillus acidophilus]|uniref:Acyl-CoA thioesterase n=1 Tax=Sulfobacillus acidophilus TaxID=53633 RepID=A0A2T2WF19_9FIRM|nr:MAG: acyl-CoA thioesterase [Sulfobacillus acidophilus]
MIFHGYDTVMFGDVDASGIGHFAHQVHFLERAEFQFMEHLHLDPRHWFLTQYLFPRVHLEVDYVSPLRFGDNMRFDVQIGHLGNTSYALHVDVINLTTQQSTMSAAVTIVVLDSASRRPCPIPVEMRTAFEPYLMTSS